MSYLHPIRLHFAGRFRADVSTVNNDPQHFNNKTFTPDIQLPQVPGDDRGWWQPAGTGAWRLLDCTVTRACRSDGSHASAATADAAVGLLVRESGDRSSAKIVDLDPDQQGVSMIFGLTVRLVDGQACTLMRGDFEPAAFFDLHRGRSSGGGDAGACAYFQSVLKNVEWGDVSASPCLTQMKQTTTANMLSIKFMTDGYRMGGPQRGYGRLVGTIGPYLSGEPRTFVIGRHLAPLSNKFAHADCWVDTARRKVLVDVGNSLPMKAGPGDFAPSGDITLAAGSGAQAPVLGSLDYLAANSYAETAGIYELPAERTLTDSELTATGQQPLQLLAKPQGGAATAILAESADGIYVRPEQFVFRLDPGAPGTTDLIVTKFGLPFEGATPVVQVQPFSLPDTSPLPTVSSSPKTGTNGRAGLSIAALDAKNPRQFIDGQVYAVLFAIQESQVNPSDFDNGNFISLLMFNALSVPSNPGWGDVRPIFEQYSHLYPRPHGPGSYTPFTGLPPSHPVVNLADQNSVMGFARHIAWALSLPVDHPSHMPVTRDLSGAKRALLLKWLNGVGASGLPKHAEALAAMAPAGATLGASAPRYAAKAFSANPDLIRHKPDNQG